MTGRASKMLRISSECTAFAGRIRSPNDESRSCSGKHSLPQARHLCGSSLGSALYGHYTTKPLPMEVKFFDQTEYHLGF